MEIRELKINISKAGGNASAAAKKHTFTIPNKWAIDMGIEKDRRLAEVIYDNTKKEIIIKLK
jgi:hypothetical protein